MKNLSRIAAVGLIIVLTFLVYAPALRNGFVWDDTALVLRDPLIRSWVLIPEGFRHFLFLDATASNFYRPIQRLSFVFDYALFGFGRPGGWHATSICIHAAAAVALFFLAEKILALAAATRLSEKARRRFALGVAAVWAIHPLHTSAVTYISGRADPLAALFGFIGLALGLASLEATATRVWRWRIGAAAAFALALFSKESGGTFLLIWLLLLGWRFSKNAALRRQLGIWLLLFAAILGGYCALRFAAEKTPPPASAPAPFIVRPILAARALAEYASLLVAPVTLRMERDVATRPRDTFEATMQNARNREFQTLAGVLLFVAFGLWVRFGVRRAPGVAICLAAFAIAYLPISNAFPLNATVAEHWLYVPSAFVFLAAALTLPTIMRPAKSESARQEIPGSAPVPGAGEGVSAIANFPDASAVESASSIEARKEVRFGEDAETSTRDERAPQKTQRAVYFVLLALLIAWAGALGVRTFMRQRDWCDQRTFIERTIAAGGDSARMWMNLANVELADGQTDRALELYREAIRRAPEQPIIQLGYAHALLRARDFLAAREALAKAETVPLLAADALLLRAAVDQAETGVDPLPALRSAVAAAPNRWPIRQRLVQNLAELGELAEAVRELGAFLEAQSFRAESWRLLATLLERAGQPVRARAAFEEAVRRDVRDASSRADAQRLKGTL